MIILDLDVFQLKLTLETAITDTQFVVTTTNYCLFQHKLHIHYIKLSYNVYMKKKNAWQWSESSCKLHESLKLKYSFKCTTKNNIAQ